MQTKVQEYLQAQREKKAEQERRVREKTLLKLGLWEPEYARSAADPDGEYPCKDEEGRRYRRVPIAVSDEEWAEIARYEEEGVLPGARRRNPVGRALWIAAMVLFIGGGTVGLLAAVDAGPLPVAVGIWVPAAVYGLVLLALSEIIRLLEKN